MKSPSTKKEPGINARSSKRPNNGASSRKSATSTATSSKSAKASDGSNRKTKTAATATAKPQRSPAKASRTPSRSPKPSRQAAGKKSSASTQVLVKADIGFGNTLYIRGGGNGMLSWDEGIALENTGPDEWVWQPAALKEPAEFKLLINDEIWNASDNFTVSPGERIVCHPDF